MIVDKTMRRLDIGDIVDVMPNGSMMSGQVVDIMEPSIVDPKTQKLQPTTIVVMFNVIFQPLELSDLPGVKLCRDVYVTKKADKPVVGGEVLEKAKQGVGNKIANIGKRIMG